MYYGNEAGYVDNGKAIVDPIFCGNELSDFLKKETLKALWTNGVYDQLSAASETIAESPQVSAMGQTYGSLANPVLKSCRVWQLKPDVGVRMKSIGYDELLKNFGEPDPANYRLAYDGQVETNNLEALYVKFNME